MNIADLKAAAEAATPGPWKVSDGGNYEATRIQTLIPQPPANHCYGDNTIVGSSEWTHVKDEDATFIALANPTTILKLIAVVEAAQWQVNSATFFSAPELVAAVEELEK
jgi:hypothetical protein